MRTLSKQTGGEWCPPTAELDRGQLASLVTRTKRATTNLEVELVYPERTQRGVAPQLRPPAASIPRALEIVPSGSVEIAFDDPELDDDADLDAVVVALRPKQKAYPVYRSGSSLDVALWVGAMTAALAAIILYTLA